MKKKDDDPLRLLKAIRKKVSMIKKTVKMRIMVSNHSSSVNYSLYFRSIEA